MFTSTLVLHHFVNPKLTENTLKYLLTVHPIYDVISQFFSIWGCYKLCSQATRYTNVQWVLQLYFLDQAVPPQLYSSVEEKDSTQQRFIKSIRKCQRPSDIGSVHFMVLFVALTRYS